MSMCGMNQGLTSVRILLSLSPLSPDTGTGSGFLHRTLVGPLAQLLSKQTSQRLTRLHILSPASESHLPLILSYVPPFGRTRGGGVGQGRRHRPSRRLSLHEARN